jgi:gibberellin A4 carboxyl methyltransferase
MHVTPKTPTDTRMSSMVLQPIFEAALQKITFPKEGPLRIVDLGCATGTNTVSHVDFVVKTLTNLCGNGYHSHGGGLMPELQAYFSDSSPNDFNGLFNLLDRRGHSHYFVAGVPRSFYNVLLPRSTIHVCFSVMGLHWLSQVPEVVVQKVSPLYNEGRV